jgi:nuclear transport factor 2 (NTF2) superfamily protein
MTRPPVPPFTAETALAKVQAAEDAWNTRDPQRVALAYTPDSIWRNSAHLARSPHVHGYLALYRTEMY